MIEIEVINAVLPAVSFYRENAKSSQAASVYCNFKLNGKDIGRTTTSWRSYDPCWNEKFVKEYQDLNIRERINNRPFYLEHVEVELFEISPTNPEKSMKIYETRVPLSNIGLFKSYKLVRSNVSKNDERVDMEITDNCRIFIRINQLEHEMYQHISSFNYSELVNVLSPKSLLYRHLYIDLDWSPWSFTYRYGLPGPLGGELVIDKYDCVELLTPVISNAFNDRLSVSCHGSLFITDLRMIFLPAEIIFPHHHQTEVVQIAPGMDTLSALQMVCLHRYTIQIPLSAINTIKPTILSTVNTPSPGSGGVSGSTGGGVGSGNTTGMLNTMTGTGTNEESGGGNTMINVPTRISMLVETNDTTTIEFIVKKASTLSPSLSGGGSTMSGSSTSFGHAHALLLFRNKVRDRIAQGQQVLQGRFTQQLQGQHTAAHTAQHTAHTAQQVYHHPYFPFTPSFKLPSSGGGGAIPTGHSPGHGLGHGHTSTGIGGITGMGSRLHTSHHPPPPGGRVKGPPRTNAVEFDKLQETYKRQMLQKLGTNPYYAIGLDTQDVDLGVWVHRVVDYVLYQQRLDLAWLRWTKYMKCSLHQRDYPVPGVSKQWLKKAKTSFDIDWDYQRHYIQDFNWRFSSLNQSYSLCQSYPATLVFPGTMSEDDLMSAAAQRSINRLPALLWLHPITKAALCRAAQPLAGMSGLLSMEYDKKLLLAIRSSCPNNLPLRIVDARPKLNANANSLQGKGFENISFLGGAAVASLTFLDIDNIHVMRTAYAKVKECFATLLAAAYSNYYTGAVAGDSPALSGGLSGVLSGDYPGTTSTPPTTPSTTTPSLPTGSVTGTNTAVATNPFDKDSGVLQTSKWTSHVCSVIKGAVSIAESLMLGYPVLVHCSDGWDRTAQLTSLSQLLLDPGYRTTDGFLILIHREWCAFGHKFEDRLGRSNLSKEISPVFVQWLDCVYQLVIQFPTAFQFTGQYLLLLIQCLQSGYFVSFRCNSEKDRLKLVHNVGIYEELSSDDMEYASLTFYVHLLLKSATIATVMINPYYQPPTNFHKQVGYLRPKCNVHDMVFWQEGLFGWNSNLLDMTNGVCATQTINTAESIAMSTNMFARYMSYVDSSLGSIPQHIRDTLEVIQHTAYPSATFPAASYSLPTHYSVQEYVYPHATVDYTLSHSVLLKKWKRNTGNSTGTSNGNSTGNTGNGYGNTGNGSGTSGNGNGNTGNGNGNGTDTMLSYRGRTGSTESYDTGNTGMTDWEWMALQEECVTMIQCWYRSMVRTRYFLQHTLRPPYLPPDFAQYIQQRYRDKHCNTKNENDRTGAETGAGTGEEEVGGVVIPVGIAGISVSVKSESTSEEDTGMPYQQPSTTLPREDEEVSEKVSEEMSEEVSMVWTRQHRVYHLLAAFAHSLAKRQAHHRRELWMSHAVFVRDILEDILFDAIERGRRSDFFAMRKSVMIANAAALFDSYGFTTNTPYTTSNTTYNTTSGMVGYTGNSNGTGGDVGRTVGRSTSSDYYAGGSGAQSGGTSSSSSTTSGKISRFFKTLTGSGSGNTGNVNGNSTSGNGNGIYGNGTNGIAVNVLPSVNEPAGGEGGEEQGGTGGETGGEGEYYDGGEDFVPRSGEVYLDYDAAYPEEGTSGSGSGGSHRSASTGNGSGGKARPNSTGMKHFTSRMFTW